MVAYRTLLGHCNAYLNSLDKCYANCELSSPNEGNLRATRLNSRWNSEFRGYGPGCHLVPLSLSLTPLVTLMLILLLDVQLDIRVPHIFGLAGTLPSQLFKLPYLDTLDLTLNYLAGEIPREWGSTKLVNMYSSLPFFFFFFISDYPNSFSGVNYLFGNRLTGSIPEEIGNITTLKRLVLRNCNITGELPDYFGRMKSLEI
uniref:Uncharacterized protein n=1 Tax=Cucumis melo TaxID=3656 RepID=A0A9I9EEM7_CUCME